MSDPLSWTSVTPTGLSDDQLHKYLGGAGNASATSSDKIGALNPAQTSDLRLLTAAGKSADYGAAASGTYDYSRDAHLKTMDALMTSWANASVSTSETKTLSSTSTLSIPTQGTLNVTPAKMLAVSAVQDKPDETITVHGNPPTSSGGYIGGFSGSRLGGDGNGNSTSRDEAGRMPASVTVTVMHSIKTVNVNGIPYVVAPDGQGLDTYQTRSGAWHALPFSMLQNAADTAAQRVLGFSATDGIMGVAYNLALNGDAGSSNFSQGIQSVYPYSNGAVADLSKVISDVQGRPVNPGDNTWIRANQNTLASGAQNLLQIRQSLAQWTANDGQYDSTFSTVHGFAPVAADRSYAAVMIGNGWSVQDYRWSEAHSDRAVADIKSFYKIILGRDAEQGGISTYTNALGTTLNRGQVASSIATSAEAAGQINVFLQNNFGHITDDLRNSGSIILSNLAQTYQTLQSYSSDALQSLAASYKAIFGQGNILQSLMPNTWQGWLELGAMVAIDLTPPGEAVAAGELLTLGGEKLIQESSHIIESRSIIDVLKGVSYRTSQKIEDVVKQISSKIGKSEEEVKKIIKKDLENSSNLPDKTDKLGKLTRAGRAAQKHGSRPGSVWPKTYGNTQQINSQALDQIDRFINQSTQLTIRNGNSVGGFDLLDTTGAGLRFDQYGNFITFLEP